MNIDIVKTILNYKMSLVISSEQVAADRYCRQRRPPQNKEIFTQ